VYLSFPLVGIQTSTYTGLRVLEELFVIGPVHEEEGYSLKEEHCWRRVLAKENAMSAWYFLQNWDMYTMLSDVS
jgi:hypothetical protein